MPVAAESLDISLRPSRLLAWIAILTYGLIALSLCFAAIPWWALGTLWLALYLQAVMQWRRIRTPLYPFELTRLRWQSNGWSLTLSDHCDDLPWQLLWLRTIPYFIFLRFKPSEGKTRALLIAKDQLTEQDYRQLLLWLQMRPFGNADQL